jgi:hypothetical protein
MPKIQQFKINTGFCRFSFRTETKTLETKQELTSKNDGGEKSAAGTGLCNEPKSGRTG